MTDLLPSVELLGREAVRTSEAAMRDWLLALLQLHDRHLYKETHTSWDAYVLDVFGYSHSTAVRSLAQAREILSLEAAPEDKAAGQDRPRAVRLPSQRQAVKAQKERKKVDAPIPAASRPVAGTDPAPPVTDPPQRKDADHQEEQEEQDEPVDVDGIGLRWLSSKTDQQIRAIADPLGTAMRHQIKRWAAAYGFVEARSPGHVITPEDRARAKAAAPVKPERRAIPVQTGSPAPLARREVQSYWKAGKK